MGVEVTCATPGPKPSASVCLVPSPPPSPTPSPAVSRQGLQLQQTELRGGKAGHTADTQGGQVFAIENNTGLGVLYCCSMSWPHLF